MSDSIINNEVRKLAENVNSLQKDMAHVGTLVDRLDVTIEKLTEVSSTVSQLLAVQGNRLEFQEKVAERLQDLVEKRRQETDSYVKDLHTKIDKVESDLQDEIVESEDKIIKKIEEMAKSSTSQHESINNSMNERMTKLERWMWLLVGGGLVVGFFLNKMPITISL